MIKLGNKVYKVKIGLKKTGTNFLIFFLPLLAANYSTIIDPELLCMLIKILGGLSLGAVIKFAMNAWKFQRENN